MTKQPQDDNPLKLHLLVEENNKANETPTIYFNEIQVKPELKQDPPITLTNNEIVPLGKTRELAVPEIGNLENWDQNEKPMKIDLDLELYQMEES